MRRIEQEKRGLTNRCSCPLKCVVKQWSEIAWTVRAWLRAAGQLNSMLCTPETHWLRSVRATTIPGYRAFCRLAGVSPSASSDRTSRSIETDGSPASIFATRDWLDLILFATATWVIRRDFLRMDSCLARLSLTSTYAASSGERLRNS